MIDIHTHILPGMDDGSGSLEESLAMAKESARQGVRLLAATPHFYATQEDPERFLQRREKSLALLESAWQEGFPTLLVGAEVRYFDGISRVEEVSWLTLDHTRILLLEMPFTSWSGRMVDEVLELQRSRGLQVLLAHVSRVLKDQDGQDTRSRVGKTECGCSATPISSCAGRQNAKRRHCLRRERSRCLAPIPTT